MSAIDDVVTKFVTQPPQEKQWPVVLRLESEIVALGSLPKSSFQGFEQYNRGYQKRFKDLQEQLLVARMADKDIYQIDLSFLGSLQSASGLPAFIIMPVEKTEFYLAFNARNSENVNPREKKIGYMGPKKVTGTSLEFRDYEHLYPIAIRTLYDNTIPKAVSLLNSKEYNKKSYIWISAKIEEGVMPQNLRNKLTNSRRLFDRIFLIMEAPTEWKINEKVVATGKRILCGSTSEDNKMFFLGSFDPIPVDQFLDDYIKKETE